MSLTKPPDDVVQMVAERLVMDDERHRSLQVEAIRGHSSWLIAGLPDYAQLSDYLSPADMAWWQGFCELDQVAKRDHVRADELIAQLMPARTLSSPAKQKTSTKYSRWEERALAAIRGRAEWMMYGAANGCSDEDRKWCDDYITMPRPHISLAFPHIWHCKAILRCCIDCQGQKAPVSAPFAGGSRSGAA